MGGTWEEESEEIVIEERVEEAVEEEGGERSSWESEPSATGKGSAGRGKSGAPIRNH